ARAGAGASRGRRCPPVAPTSAVVASLRLPCATRLGARGETRCAHFVRCARTVAASQLTKRASTRAAPKLRCSALHTARPAVTAYRYGTAQALCATNTRSVEAKPRAAGRPPPNRWQRAWPHGALQSWGWHSEERHGVARAA